MWTNGAGGVIAITVMMVVSGCGGDNPVGTGTGGAQETIAALGDSITAGSPLWDPDPAVRSGLGSSATSESQYEHWATEALEGSVRFRNCGVFGERTDEIALRLDDCVVDADTVIIQGGINDIAQGRPAADAADDLEAMVARVQELGGEPILVDVLPWNNGYPDAAPQIEELNRLIGASGEEHDVPVLGFYESLEDPHASGRMADEWTIDGDHPSVDGYRRLGLLVADQLRGG